MSIIQMPEISLPTEDDWKYYCTFGSPQVYLREMERGLNEDNRFFCDFRLLKLLYWYAHQTDIRATVNYILYPDQKLFRARIYDKTTDSEEKSPEFLGYGPNNSFVPPEHIMTSAGRANPRGIRYLYAAVDARTAITEANPLLKDDVSVAEISVQEKLSILNFANTWTSTVGEDGKYTEWKRQLPLAFTEIFNAPQRDTAKYILCQYLSECIKNLGYDGIRFASSKIKIDPKQRVGINYTIFNYQKCRATSSRLYYVNDLNYTLRVQNDNGFFGPF